MKLRRLGLLLLPLALLAAGARPASSSPAPRLLSPRPGAELAAGSLATVEWEGAPAGAEEWEAFLSLDGGRTYPLRVTPHLDLSIRRFNFRVPPVPTREARMMLRFGDERRETEVEAPQRFAIVPGGVAWPLRPAAAFAPGEKPRPRDPGVVVWVEGARDGSGLREVAAAAAPISLRSLAPARPPWLPLLWPARDRTGLAAPSGPGEEATSPARRAEAGPPAPPPERVTVRLLTHRFNE